MVDKGQRGWVGAVFLLIVVFVVLAGGFLIVKDRNKTQPSTETVATPDEPQKTYAKIGFSISPRSYDAAGLTEFFERVEGVSGILTWAGDWDELGKAGKGPSMLMNNADKYGYNPIAGMTTHKDAGGGKVTLIRELSETQISAYIEQAREYGKTHKPQYLGVGIEVNRIYESSPAEYQAFALLFQKTAQAIHEVSPSTKVFTSFQLERIRGLKGGLYGGINDESNNEWALLNDFSDADLLAFTSYPELIYKTPAEIPDDYYSDIKAFTTKPIAISELGWPSANVATGWGSSPETQTEFLSRYFGITKDVGLEFSVWSFMYDQQIPAPFSNLGLIDPQNQPKLAWQTFVGQ